jgi:hypothetical protein
MSPEVQAMSPAQRMTAGYCPECGLNLTGINVISHSREHWPQVIPDRADTQEARVRQRMMQNYYDAQVAAAAAAAAQAAQPANPTPAA